MMGSIALAGIGFAASTEVDRTVRSELPVEAALSRAAARGDRSAFARLVELHQRAVFALCVRLLGDREEARDAAQEALVRAWAAIATYDPAQPFAPWVLRIARNHCVDVARRRLPPGRTLELDAPGPGGGDPPELRDRAGPADDRLATAQLAAAVEAAVASLPANQREVVHLFHVDHLSYKEIAAVMDVPMGTVMTWLHRARARLREALAARGELP
jgi:RNA polymerase sigma-70 factor (ECF subfamily)